MRRRLQNFRPRARRGDAEHRAQVAVVTWATLALPHYRLAWEKLGNEKLSD